MILQSPFGGEIIFKRGSEEYLVLSRYKAPRRVCSDILQDIVESTPGMIPLEMEEPEYLRLLGIYRDYPNDSEHHYVSDDLEQVVEDKVMQITYSDGDQEYVVYLRNLGDWNYELSYLDYGVRVIIEEPEPLFEKFPFEKGWDPIAFHIIKTDAIQSMQNCIRCNSFTFDGRIN
jgi:hypothetical protein